MVGAIREAWSRIPCAGAPACYCIHMNSAAKTTRATKSEKMLAEACALFGVEAPNKVPTILFALGLREICSRCGGSGHYSFNQIDGSRCFGCSGAGKRAATLTAAVLEAARVKVEAGELEALRAAGRAKNQARREIAPLVEAARAVYMTIAESYEASYKPGGGSIPEPLMLAQTMNNAIFWGTRVDGGSELGITGILSDVKSGKCRDYLAARARVIELTADLETLRSAWLSIQKL